MNEKEFCQLLREQRQEDIARAYAESFVEYILSEASDYGEFEGDIAGDCIIKLASELHSAGYRVVEYPDDEVKIQAYAGPDAYYRIRDDYDYSVNLDLTDVDTLTIQGITVKLDPSLPDDAVIAVHLDAVVPARPSSRKSWLVKDSDGVMKATIPTE